MEAIKTRLPINKVAHGIGMQNQYLSHAVREGKVVGEIHREDYHSDLSWVDIQSVQEYVDWRLENWVISKEQHKVYTQFLKGLLIKAD
jgi:ribosome maturation protein Sdo1